MMGNKRVEYIVAGVLVTLAVVLPDTAFGYPWLHYFEKPEMQWLHFALPDAQGDILVASGDYDNWDYQGKQVYRFKGLYSIDGSDIRELACPGGTHILDGVIDSENRTWLLMAGWLGWNSECTGHSSQSISADSGYHDARYPSVWCCYLEDFRLAMVDGDRLVEHPELTDWVPGDVVQFSRSEDGWPFLVSWETNDSPSHFEVFEEFISWWSEGDPTRRHTLSLQEAFPTAGKGRVMSYPRFGPDGLVYFIVSYCQDSASQGDDETCRDGVFVINPERSELGTYSYLDSPFLDSEIECFYVDEMNVKWFGTHDGLVRFDGDTWRRYTTDNSALAFNIIRSIAYDDVDQVHYVISQDCVNGEYPTALSYLGSDGEFLSSSAYFGSISYWKLYAPMLVQDDRQTWWFEPYDSYTLYSYDHERVMMWDCRDWLDTSVGGVAHVGSTANGHRFAVTASCVMVW